MQDIPFSTKCLIFTGGVPCCFFLDFSYFLIIAFKIAKLRMTVSLENYTYILKIRNTEFIVFSVCIYISKEALYKEKNHCKMNAIAQKCLRLNTFIKNGKVVSFANFKEENKGDEKFLKNR